MLATLTVRVIDVALEAVELAGAVTPLPEKVTVTLPPPVSKPVPVIVIDLLVAP